MTRQVAFDRDGSEDYAYWQSQDLNTLNRINVLIQEILRDPFN